ncbi:MAG: 4Fe-4S binding protein [Dehalococcoidales bacterium]|nr:4Fe-4S binding protein [Dehalococcoidales bacterium]
MVSNMPVIDTEKCDKCGLCISICKCGILVMGDDGVKAIESEDCSRCTTWCNTCELVCPTGAITCPFEVVLEDGRE